MQLRRLPLNTLLLSVVHPSPHLLKHALHKKKESKLQFYLRHRLKMYFKIKLEDIWVHVYSYKKKKTKYYIIETSFLIRQGQACNLNRGSPAFRIASRRPRPWTLVFPLTNRPYFIIIFLSFGF